ncbi:MAG TPA: hypothetical protein VFO19_11260 [Vicinamibacterales bacterium]|nr:hypothetical protein [Vicinamibacterales bacterium]
MAAGGDGWAAANAATQASGPLVTAAVTAKCAGFTRAHAGEILSVPEAAVTERRTDITPTTRGCDYSAGAKKIAFSLALDSSAAETRRRFEDLRETYTIAGRAAEAAGKVLPQGAYTDILNVGEEALWSATNESVAVRHKNLTILVMLPNDKRTQAAIATKILALLGS